MKLMKMVLMFTWEILGEFIQDSLPNGKIKVLIGITQ